MSSFAERLVWRAALALLRIDCQTVTGRSSEQQSATPTPIPTPLVPEQPTFVVQRGDPTNKIEFTGRISAVDEQTLFFKSVCYVKEVYVDRDDVVQAGDLLAELEMEEPLKPLAQAEVPLNSVQFRLEEAEKSQEPQVAQAELEMATAHRGRNLYAQRELEHLSPGQAREGQTTPGGLSRGNVFLQGRP
jgi:multidrug efflux pump subunit AcrA (membrane-fusion protein)